MGQPWCYPHRLGEVANFFSCYYIIETSIAAFTMEERAERFGDGQAHSHCVHDVFCKTNSAFLTCYLNESQKGRKLNKTHTRFI